MLRYDAGAGAADLPAASDLSIIAAPGEEREMREIARAILAHVEQGGRLDEVGILLRQPAAYLPAIRDVFAAAGIPYTPGHGARGRGDAGRAEPSPAGRGAPIGLRARGAVMEFLAFADLRPGPEPARRSGSGCRARRGSSAAPRLA